MKVSVSPSWSEESLDLSSGMTCARGTASRLAPPYTFWLISVISLRVFSPSSITTSLCALAPFFPSLLLPGQWQEGWEAVKVCNKSHPCALRKHKHLQKKSPTCTAPMGKRQREDVSGTCRRLRAKASTALSRNSQYAQEEALAWGHQHPGTISCTRSYSEHQKSALQGKGIATLKDRWFHTVLGKARV